MRSRAKFGKLPAEVRDDGVVTLTTVQSHDFRVDDVILIDGSRCIVTGVVDSASLTLRQHPTPHEWVKLFLRFILRGARRWLSRVWSRCRGARS